ncbi:hypothetical protein L1887_01503 [Cichorium endivia]|nr:hypothetical protein L1887_01503 [Cichorium endivia]
MLSEAILKLSIAIQQRRRKQEFGLGKRLPRRHPESAVIDRRCWILRAPADSGGKQLIHQFHTQLKIGIDSKS